VGVKANTAKVVLEKTDEVLLIFVVLLLKKYKMK